jgi:hypothetical protein
MPLTSSLVRVNPPSLMAFAADKQQLPVYQQFELHKVAPSPPNT